MSAVRGDGVRRLCKCRVLCGCKATRRALICCRRAGENLYANDASGFALCASTAAKSVDLDRVIGKVPYTSLVGVRSLPGALAEGS